jgi:hypothetical protein
MKTLELEKTWHDDAGFRLVQGYDGFVQSFEVETVAFANTGSSYQGDMHYMLFDKNNGEYAYLCIGYGSCSGCDWLEAMEGSSEAEFIEARDDLWNGLEWKTGPDMLAWLRDDARTRDFSYFDDKDEWMQFLADSAEKLVGLV